MNFKIMDALLQSVNGFTGSLEADYLHLKGAKNSTDHFYTELRKAGIVYEKTADSFDEALVALENEYERQGFINGFRMGARLMLECFGPVFLEAWDPNEVGKPLSRAC